MDYGAYHHGVISIWDMLWVIISALVHRYFRPSDVLADFWHGGIKGAHSSSLCLCCGRSEECVKGTFFVLHWVTLASTTLYLFSGFGGRVFVHITAIPGLLVLVYFSFATRLLSPAVLEASFLIHLEVIDKLAVPVGVVALSRGVTMGKTWHIAVFVVRHRGGWRRSGSGRTPRLTTTTSASSATLAALALVSKGCGHHVRSLGFFWRILTLVAAIPLSSVLDGGSLQRFASVIGGGHVVACDGDYGI
jgi:hypothetical protein